MGVISRVFGSWGSMTDTERGGSRISNDLIGCPTRSKFGVHLGMFPVSKNSFSCEMDCVVLNNVFSRTNTVLRSLYTHNFLLCRNQEIRG